MRRAAFERPENDCEPDHLFGKVHAGQRGPTARQEEGNAARSAAQAAHQPLAEDRDDHQRCENGQDYKQPVRQETAPMHLGGSNAEASLSRRKATTGSGDGRVVAGWQNGALSFDVGVWGVG